MKLTTILNNQAPVSLSDQVSTHFLPHPLHSNHTGLLTDTKARQPSILRIFQGVTGLFSSLIVPGLAPSLHVGSTVTTSKKPSLITQSKHALYTFQSWHSLLSTHH